MPDLLGTLPIIYGERLGYWTPNVNWQSVKPLLPERLPTVFDAVEREGGNAKHLGECALCHTRSEPWSSQLR